MLFQKVRISRVLLFVLPLGLLIGGGFVLLRTRTRPADEVCPPGLVLQTSSEAAKAPLGGALPPTRMRPRPQASEPVATVSPERPEAKGKATEMAIARLGYDIAIADSVRMIEREFTQAKESMKLQRAASTGPGSIDSGASLQAQAPYGVYRSRLKELLGKGGMRNYREERRKAFVELGGSPNTGPEHSEDRSVRKFLKERRKALISSVGAVPQK